MRTWGILTRNVIWDSFRLCRATAKLQTFYGTSAAFGLVREDPTCNRHVIRTEFA